ncbi:hypothetical protein M2283_004896 [Streptomyces pseudovenezuelae]|uniref:Transposase n=1 Tax=Streptomyces pseudovenezuelae TaxID=67350 RepID=A0ABT6LMP0_9ACTN|nr:hypothetical protein [Streptomyces pseudovenezuelae]
MEGLLHERQQIGEFRGTWRTALGLLPQPHGSPSPSNTRPKERKPALPLSGE